MSRMISSWMGWKARMSASSYSCAKRWAMLLAGAKPMRSTFALMKQK